MALWAWMLWWWPMTQAVKSTNSNAAEHRRELATAINAILQGRINTANTFTMVNGTTSTTVTDTNAHQGSHISIAPLSAGVPAGWYVSARNAGSFVVTHTNPGADKSLSYVLLG